MKRMEIDSPEQNLKKPSMMQSFNQSVIGKVSNPPVARDFRKPKVESYMPSPRSKHMKSGVLAKKQ